MESSLKDQIFADMKLAMKNKENAKLQALRLVHADVKNQEIDQKTSLNDLQVISILRKHIKQHEESIDQCQKAQRAESLKEQKEKMQVIQSYLPKPLSEQELKTAVDKVISQLQVRSIKQMGLVIKEVQSQTAGSVDNRKLATLVKERLQNI